MGNYVRMTEDIQWDIQWDNQVRTTEDISQMGHSTGQLSADD